MKVVFVQPASFLRSERGTNPYFDPLIAACDRNGIDWRIFIAPEDVAKCGYPADRVGSYSWLRRLAIWFYRFCRLFAWHLPAWRICRLFARVARPLFARRFAADVVVTIAGMFIDELAVVLPRARIVDLQHGIIYSRHSGYFDGNGRLWPHHRRGGTGQEYWLYGPGYADCFFKNPENAKDLEGRVKIIGDVARAGEDGRVEHAERAGERKLVAFSLQLTHDFDRQTLEAAVRGMEKFFAGFIAKHGDAYQYAVKHHPRYNNAIDLADFFRKFPQVKETKEPWTGLYGRMALHVTFSSTVTFDCASVGVPTFLLAIDRSAGTNLDNAFYKNDYGYPYCGMTADWILAIPADEARKTVLEWYRRFYSPFEEAGFLKLLEHA